MRTSPLPGWRSSVGNGIAQWIQWPSMNSSMVQNGWGRKASQIVEGFTSAEYTDVANVSYPTELETEPEPKASIYFAADGLWGPSRSLAAYCSETGQDGAQYGLADGQGEYPGNILPVVGSLPAKKLLNPKNKRTVVDLGRTVDYPNGIQTDVGGPVSTGRTRVDVTLTFTRVK